MLQLNNLRDWKSLAEGEVLELKKNRHRSVKLYVSAPDETRIFFQTPGDEPGFLALVKGLETISFNVDGPIDIISEGPIRFRTADNERAVAKPDGEKFTKMMERAPRNPELEAIQYQMHRNMERRLAQQQAEFLRTMDMRARVDAARIAKMENELELMGDDEQPESVAGDDDAEPGEGADTGDGVAPGANSAPAGSKRKPARRKRSTKADAE